MALKAVSLPSFRLNTCESKLAVLVLRVGRVAEVLGGCDGLRPLSNLFRQRLANQWTKVVGRLCLGGLMTNNRNTKMLR